MSKVCIAMILGLFIYSCSQPNSPGLDSVSDQLITGSVPIINTQELESLLSQSAITLIDAREKEEYEISHIPEATWVGFEAFEIESVADFDRNEPIVVYCSVGYRSEKIGEKLKAAGFVDVRNLFGGIFMWANQGRSLVDLNNQPTRSVHGFSRNWSRYLSPKVDVRLN